LAALRGSGGRFLIDVQFGTVRYDTASKSMLPANLITVLSRVDRVDHPYLLVG